MSELSVEPELRAPKWPEAEKAVLSDRVDYCYPVVQVAPVLVAGAAAAVAVVLVEPVAVEQAAESSWTKIFVGHLARSRKSFARK